MSKGMRESVAEGNPLAIRSPSTGAQLLGTVPIAQAAAPSLRQVSVDNSLPIVAALAAIVAVVATAVAWRAGRRARRAADLVAQLLEPPVLVPVVGESPGLGTEEPVPAVTTTVTTTVTMAADVDGAGLGSPGEPLPAIEMPALAARDDRRDIPTSADEGHDPGPTRIPVLDLDRLRSWLTLGDVNLGRLAIVSVELDNLALRRGTPRLRRGWAPPRSDHATPPHGDPAT